MKTRMPNLFIAARYDAAASLLHSVAYLCEEGGEPVARVAMSQKAGRGGPGFDGGHAAGLAAFEAGCLMAKQAGARRILLHAPEDVDHDVMFNVREDKGMAFDGDGGADYFDMDVFVYRPGEGAEKSGWQQAAWDKAQSVVSNMAAGAPEAAL